MLYRQLPIQVKAWQFIGLPEPKWISKLVRDESITVDFDGVELSLSVKTDFGWARIVSGDWIVSGYLGELSVFKPDVFKENYEKIL
jgi:hypothetical protein